MADTVHRISEQVIDWAMRVEDISDAAKGKGSRRRGSGTRWLILPAAGAGLYALATSGAFSRQAKDVVDQARSRASELPDDLMGRLRQTTGKTASGNGDRSREAGSSRKSKTRRKASVKAAP
jgi:hypothetical protein